MPPKPWHPCCESDWRQSPSVSAHRLFFLHIPKTGGITVENVLKRYFAWRDLCPRYYVGEWTGFEPADAGRFRLFIGHSDVNVASALPEDVRRAIVLRDPLRQILSFYNHIVERPAHPLHARLTTGGIGFADFIELRDAQNFQSSFLFGWEQWRNRAADLDTAAATQTVLASLNRFDLVGTTEDLPRFFAGLSRLLDVPPIRDWPHLNPTQRRAVSIDDVSPDVSRKHREISAIDYALYARAVELAETEPDRVTDESTRPAA